MLKLNIPDEWKQEARQATQELMNLPEDGRTEFINRHSRIWQALKPELERVSHNKCWYCEAKNIRWDAQVDHQRPKNKVRKDDATEESGYWWLAFDYRNFRLACSFCNCLHTGKDGLARGKSINFPISEGSTRATASQPNLDDETPLLLDPTVLADTLLLWFLDDGRACPKYPEACGLLHQKAESTIDILNLNDSRICEARRELWLRCLCLIERGDRVYAKWKSGSHEGAHGFENVIEEMWRLIQLSAEFSATARACFRGSSCAWVKEIFQ